MPGQTNVSAATQARATTLSIAAPLLPVDQACGKKRRQRDWVRLRERGDRQGRPGSLERPAQWARSARTVSAAATMSKRCVNSGPIATSAAVYPARILLPHSSACPKRQTTTRSENRICQVKSCSQTKGEAVKRHRKAKMTSDGGGYARAKYR